jgi:C4-dicarboxylate-specific signal transduction histidine kinase
MTSLTPVDAFAVLADVTTPDPDSVTPGIVGFIVTFAVAIITVLLIVDMVRRVRRVNLRAQVREELEAEVAARDADGTAPTRGASSPATDAVRGDPGDSAARPDRG